MAIEQVELRQAASRGNPRNYKAAGQRTAFLCHSHKDRDLALGVQQRLKEQGLDLYIDWQDATMPPEPNRRTAERIQNVIRQADLFLFLATADSMASRWCPWELGFADGVKRQDQLALIPTRDASGNYHGNEYLQLYRRIDTPGTARLWYWTLAGSNTTFPIPQI